MDAFLRRREALQSDLRQAEHDRQVVSAISTADPGAVALATYAGAIGLRTDPQQLGLWLPLIGVLALELGAAFSVVLVRSVNCSHLSHVAQAQTASDPVAQESAAQIRKSESGPGRATRVQRKRQDHDDNLGPPKRGLPTLLESVKANGGVINLSQRKLARQLGASRTTLQRALSELAATGVVMLDMSRSGTRLAVA